MLFGKEFEFASNFTTASLRNVTAVCGLPGVNHRGLSGRFVLDGWPNSHEILSRITISYWVALAAFVKFFGT